MFRKQTGKKENPGCRRLLAEHLEARNLLATVDVPAVADNTLYEDLAGSISNGAGEHVFVGRNRQGNVRRGLFQFDVAGSLPDGATVSSASLQLHVSKSRPGSDTISLHRVLAAWGEGDSDATGSEGLGASASEGDATWLDRTFGSGLWETAGGDFTATSTAGTSVGGAGDYTWSSPQMVRDVQGWFDDPASNFGWLLMGNELTNQTAVRFDSRENSTESVRPVLTINFTSDNKAPTDINLSNNSVSEAADVSQPLTIGALSAVDEDENDAHTFTLVDGPGASDNALFQIVDNQLELRAGAVLDHETQSTLGIGVSVTDAGGESTAKAFTIDVANANEPPIVSEDLQDLYLVGGTNTSHMIPASTFSDPDQNDTLTLSAQLEDNSPLPAWLTLDSATDAFAAQPSDNDAGILTVTVTASDSGQPSLQAADTMGVIVTRSTAPWQSPLNPLDVDPDGFIVPRDVLILINELNDPQHVDDERKLVGVPRPGVGFFDVSGDGFATPLDALQIVNFLNEPSPEAEAIAIVVVQSQTTTGTEDEPNGSQLDEGALVAEQEVSLAVVPIKSQAKSHDGNVPSNRIDEVSLEEALDELV